MESEHKVALVSVLVTAAVSIGTVIATGYYQLEESTRKDRCDRISALLIPIYSAHNKAVHNSDEKNATNKKEITAVDHAALLSAKYIMTTKELENWPKYSSIKQYKEGLEAVTEAYKECLGPKEG